MAMFNPPHPGKGIKDEIDALGLSTTQAAKALGISCRRLHCLMTGTSDITDEIAERLESVIGSTANHWMRLQSSYNLAQLRLNKPDDTKS